MTREEYNLIVKELKSKREELRLKQEDIAKKCNCSFSTISSIERERSVAKSRMFLDYILAVGLEMPSIFSEVNVESMEKFYENLPKMLKSKRETIGLSLEDIATKCGISVTMLKSYDRGFIDLNAVAFLNYLEAVGLDTSFAPAKRVLDENSRVFQDVEKDLKTSYNLIVKKLRSKREELRLKQEDIAKKCNCSVSAISSIERGNQIATAVILFGYMEAVGIDVNSFIADSKVSDEWVRFLELLSKEEQEEVLNEFKNAKEIDPELLKKIESMNKDEQKQLNDRAEKVQKVNSELLDVIASMPEENQIKLMQFIQIFR